MKPFKSLKAAISWLKGISGCNGPVTNVGVYVVRGRSEELYDIEMNAFGAFKLTRVM